MNDNPQSSRPKDHSVENRSEQKLFDPSKAEFTGTSADRALPRKVGNAATPKSAATANQTASRPVDLNFAVAASIILWIVIAIIVVTILRLAANIDF